MVLVVVGHACFRCLTYVVVTGHSSQQDPLVRRGGEGVPGNRPHSVVAGDHCRRVCEDQVRHHAHVHCVQNQQPEDEGIAVGVLRGEREGKEKGQREKEGEEGHRRWSWSWRWRWRWRWRWSCNVRSGRVQVQRRAAASCTATRGCGSSRRRWRAGQRICCSICVSGNAHVWAFGVVPVPRRTNRRRRAGHPAGVHARPVPFAASEQRGPVSISSAGVTPAGVTPAGVSPAGVSPVTPVAPVAPHVWVATSPNRRPQWPTVHVRV